MAIERTLSIIKPNAVAAKVVGKIISCFEEEGLAIIALRRMRLSRPVAEAFYAVHEERPFYASLCDFMTSGPVVVMCLEGEGAIERNRGIMGATDPAKAEEETLRKLYGDDIEQNAVHGSDSPETAAAEVAFFFPELELL